MYSFGIPNCITDLVPTIWRFLPAVDPLVDEFHSRDLDSLVSQREFDAVNEFRNWKNAQFHIMRDHKMHSAPILGNTRMYRGYYILGVLMHKTAWTLYWGCNETLKGGFEIDCN